MSTEAARLLGEIQAIIQEDAGFLPAEVKDGLLADLQSKNPMIVLSAINRAKRQIARWKSKAKAKPKPKPKQIVPEPAPEPKPPEEDDTLGLRN